MTRFDPDEVKRRLRNVAPLARTALAAAAAERVNPVYEKHWVGGHFDGVRGAIDYAWTLVEGKPPEPTRAATLLAGIEEHATYFSEEGISLLESAVSASQYVLETLSSDVDAAVLGVSRTIGAALHVARLAAKLSTTVDPNAAEAEELQWQERAIQLVSTNPPPWRADVFRALGSDPPAWRVAYETGPTHLI